MPLWDHAIHINFQVQTLWENLYHWINLAPSFTWRPWVPAAHKAQLLTYIQTLLWGTESSISSKPQHRCGFRDRSLQASCPKSGLGRTAPSSAAPTLFQQSLCPFKHSHEPSCHAPGCTRHPQLKFKNLTVVCHPVHNQENQGNQEKPP